MTRESLAPPRMAAMVAMAAMVSMTLALSSCRSPIPKLPDDVRYGRPLPAGDPRPALLLAALETRRESVSALRGRAHLSLDAPDLRFRRPQRMALSRPDWLRVEIIGLFNQTAAVLVTRDGRFQFLDAGSGELSEGAASKDLLWEIVRVDLAPDEVVALALGAPLPALGLAYDGAEAFDAEDEETGERVALRFASATGALRERLWFDADARLLRLEVFDALGKRESDVRWKDFRALGPVAAFAHEVDLLFPRVEARARLRFSSVELSETLPASLFELSR